MQTIPDNPQLHHSKWKELYRIGGVSCIIVSALILIAVIAYFIWPYAPMDHTTESIFSTLVKDPVGGLISLDLIMLITILFNILPLLAFYAALKEVSESYALVALVFGLLAVATVIPSRPLEEMLILSHKYAAAETDIQRTIYVSAGEVYRLLFDGTAWIIQTVLLILSGLIYSLLMLRSRMFSKTLAWTGIIIAVFGLGFAIPKAGVVFLFLNTILTIPWYIFIARVFLKYSRLTNTN